MSWRVCDPLDRWTRRTAIGCCRLICRGVLSRGQGEAAPGWLLGRRFVGPDQVDELACVSVRDGAVRLIFAGWLPQDGLFGWSASAAVSYTHLRAHETDSY